ncbi:MAG TPA: ABC transporter permease, partial [Vicinamibacterales bacterium]|nr:ABC transporter permease [Vicinamibacterales bacterium]
MPDWAPVLRARLAGLRLGAGREAEIVEELSQHLDQRYEELRAGGAADEEARRLAIQELREPDVLAQQMASLRQAHVPPPGTPGRPGGLGPGSLWQDLAFAGRLLRKQPGFAVAVVLTLALGIGANTAIFSLVNATLLRRLPVANPDRLTYVLRGGTGGVFAYPMYAHLRDGNDVFDGFAAWGGITVSLHAGDAAELVQGAIVTGNLFEVLGVRAAHGRLLGVRDDLVRGAHPVAVISYDYWRSRFGGRPDVLGREVRLNGHAFTIVGVAPDGFPAPELGSVYNLYVPMMMQAVVRPPRAGYSGEQNPDLLNHPTASWLYGVARLKPGTGAEQARAQLDTLAAGYLRTLPQAAAPPRITLVPLDEGDPNRRQQMQSVALLLGGVAAAVLLIACANIANLLLSRIASRRREFAVRLALGASGARLVQQLLTESLLLSLLGGAVGVGLAWAVVEAFQAAPLPAALPPIDLSIDRRVLLFSIALSCLTGIVFGAAPAVKASRPGLVPALKDALVEGDGRRRRLDLKKTLVVAEVALSLLLLIAAGLFVRSLLAARAIDPGFDAAR